MRRHRSFGLLVVIDVKLCIRVCSTSRLESDPHKVLADNIVKDTVAQGTILVEDFIQNILI